MVQTISMTQARNILAEKLGQDPTNINNKKVLDSKLFTVINKPDISNNSAPWELTEIKH
jgi:hypothetical protein